MASAQPGAEGRSDDDAIAAPSDANAVTNASNMPGMSIVGPECAAAGITPTVLQNGWGENQERIPVTNMMVAEIAAYREKSKATYPVAKKWLEKLLGQGTFDGVKESSFESSLRSRRTKMAKAKRNKTPKLLEELREVYRPPIPRVPDNAQVPPQPSTSSMSQKLQAARLTKLALQREVREKELEIGKMVVKNFSLEKELEARDRKQKEEEKKMKKRKELLQKKEAKVQQKVITLNVKSWREKLKRRDSKIREQQQKLDMMADTKSELKELKKGKGKESRQLEYWKRRSRALEEDLKAMKKKEKAKEKRVSNLEVEVEDLVEKVREKQRSINLRDGLHKNSPFTFDVRACYMQLLSFQVSAHNLSNVAHCVLSTLGKFDVQRSDFPGETFCQEMLLEANLVTSIQVAEGLTKTTNATIQSDGTTRDGNKVVGMQANADGRTSTIGLQQVSSGTAEDQLDAFQFIFNKMAELTSSPDNTETTYNELVSTLKNTMGDGAASQKLFNELLENYRRDILPKVKENWDTFTTQQQESLAKMNHQYCNLHALIGFATYADTSLAELEKVWREKDGQLGVEGLREFQDSSGNYSWKHKDSATQRLIRTTCDAFAPGGNQQAGRIQTFKDFLQSMQSDEDGLNKRKNIVKLKAFRANRFNILFEAAAAVYYHKDDVQKMFEEGYVKADNKLLMAVLADCSCQPLRSACRALGIIDVQITKPYWQLIEMKHVHILDLSTQLQTALAKFKEWSNDATPLLQPDITPLFTTSHGPVVPIQDELFQCLYTPTSDSVTTMTKQALEVILSNMIVVLERRFPEQLHGAYSNSDDPTLRQEMEGMEKSNRRGENDFGYWSHIITVKPSISLMAAEGQLMYKTNNTAQWLSDLSDNNPDRYRAILSLVRKEKNTWKDKYKARHKKQQQVREEKLHARAAEHASNVKKKEAQQEKKKELLETHGGPALTPAECEAFLANISSLPATKQKNTLRTHISYMKEKYTTFSKSKTNSHLFALSSGGKTYTEDKLAANLRSIVGSPEFTAQTQSQAPAETTVPAQQQQITLTEEDVEDKVARIKARFAMKAAECSKEQKNDERPDENPAQDSDEEGSEEESEEESGEEESEEDSGEEESGEDSGEEESGEDSDEEESGEDSDAGEEDPEESEEEDGHRNNQNNTEPPAKKRKTTEEDEKDDEEIANGSMIVVAYEDDWALGEVIEVQDDGELLVKYMLRKKSKKGKCTFYWPRRESVYSVDHKFILCTMASSKVLPNKDTLGRDSVIPDADYVTIQRKYNSYFNKYFVKKHRVTEDIT